MTLHVPDGGERRHADLVRLAAAAVVALIAGTMLAAWIAGLDVATRTDTLAPMSPLGCIGFLAGALGVSTLLRGSRVPVAAGVLTALAGVLGLADALLADGRTFNGLILGTHVPISGLTAAALVLLGSAITLDSRGSPSGRRLAIVAGALGAAASIGFLLGVPSFYGSSRSVHISWQASLCTFLLAGGIAALDPSGPLFDRGLAGHFARRTLPAVIGIPVAAGALCAAAARAGVWAFSTAAWVMTLAAVAGSTAVVAMAAQRLKEDDRRLTELAIRDPLTGAYNRRHFVAEAQKASARSRRYEESGAIAVVDLDRFKEINDRWGHAAGDDALVRVYRALRSRLRSSDVLGRIGGDEFAALILHVDPLGAARVADELRAAVAGVGEELTAEGRRNRLSASVGVAALDPNEDVDALIDLADRRMYDEKRLAQEVESGADH
jgi:diguanylate cyclase (GGDEF)-like protein